MFSQRLFSWREYMRSVDGAAALSKLRDRQPGALDFDCGAEGGSLTGRLNCWRLRRQ